MIDQTKNVSTHASPSPELLASQTARCDSAHLTVSVIVPVHRDGDAFRACLASLRAARRAPDEIIVVSDGGTDDLTSVEEEYSVRLIQATGPNGPAAARNGGASAASGDILLFVDADVTIPPSAIDQVVEFFAAHAQVSAVIGSYDDAPQAENFLSQYKNLLQHHVHQHAREEGFTFWGACGAIRRQAFLEIGGYDESYRQPCIEDIELGYRLRAAGHRIRVCKSLQVKHLKRWTPVSLFCSDFFRRALPWTRLILRTGGLENDLNIDRASRLKVALVYSLVIVLGVSWWWTAGWLVAALIAVTLVILDASLLRLFQRKRGVLFALRALLWHWFYYWYSGLAFAIGLTTHLFRRRSAQR